jgi:hypothetical protein
VRHSPATLLAADLLFAVALALSLASDAATESNAGGGRVGPAPIAERGRSATRPSRPLQAAGLAETRITVAYHAQQDPDWCDPADIEMWLQAEGIPLPSNDDHSIQQMLWDFETSNNDGYTVSQWNASPYAVAVTLDRYGGWTDVGDAPQPSADAAGIVISKSLAIQHQPVIVMVGGGTHYILVTGVALGPGGVAAPPTQVTYADPLAYGVGGSPPPGLDGTSTVSWAQFTTWYTANTAHGGIWAGDWVLIATMVPLVG